MSRPKPRNIPLTELVEAAEDAVRDGRFAVARGLAEDAMTRAPRNPTVRQLGCLIAMAADDMTTAIADASRWLALAPADANAARAFTRLADTYEIEDVGVLDPRGLSVALSVDGVSRAGVAKLALRRALDGDRSMLAVLDAAPAEIERAGRVMATTRRLPQALTSDLYRAGLAAHVLGEPLVERFLTGFRAGLLLDAGAEVLADPDRFSLSLAMLAQLWLNDHAWAETAAEHEAVARLAVDPARVVAGDVAAARIMLLRQLYVPLDVGGSAKLTAAQARSVRPKAYGQQLAERLTADEEEMALASALPRLGSITDKTSQAVKAQYEAAPYPRWSSIAVPETGSLIRFIKAIPGVGDTTALDRPFDVLIAGAGTGQQAVRSACGYGPSASVVALDLSARSLGYAARQASAFGIDSVFWLQGDLLVADQLGRKFQIIECVGVLHHMADPFDGWRRLLAMLEPDGLMYVGLYSETARKPITIARNDPESPGPGCDDAAARAWRRALMDRPADAATSSLRVSRNFNALAEFRDLVLHASERQMTLAAIATFIEAERLRFLGFMLPPHVLAAFTKRFPDHPLPGRLADWAMFEVENPSTFEGMYCFWCARA